MKKIFIVLDLEATCWDREDKNKPVGFRNEIIEIGAVKCDDQGNILDEFCLFLKPKKHPIISEFCTTLTTITQKDIDNAIDAETGLMQFFRWAYGDAKTAEEIVQDVKFVSWGHYDKRQFRDDLKLNNLNVGLINDQNHYSLKHMHGDWNKMKKPVGLGWACKFEKIEFTGTAHRGIDDAKNVAKIFKKYAHKF
jgi:3'-5' exoribonuclease 1